jgi:hypothetical protein
MQSNKDLEDLLALAEKLEAEDWESMFLGGPLQPEPLDLYTIHNALKGIEVARVGYAEQDFMAVEYSGDADVADYIGRACSTLPRLIRELLALRANS